MGFKSIIICANCNETTSMVIEGSYVNVPFFVDSRLKVGIFATTFKDGSFLSTPL